MRFICKSNSTLNLRQIELMESNSCRIEYTAKLGFYYIVEALSASHISDLNIFDSVSVPAKLKLADVSLFPQISNKPLKKEDYVGWKVKVAVIDSGLKTENGLNIIYSKDYTGNSHTIANNHGTQVAKIIQYFAPRACFINLKVSHDFEFSEDYVIPALDEAMDQEADIINLSFGILRKQLCIGNCVICDYVNKVSELGYTVITASGNEGVAGTGSVCCPGRAEKSITVGQVDKTGKNVSSHSGKGMPDLLKPNIIAPGEITVVIDKTYTYNSGTSFSTPVVAGVLASMFHLSYDRRTIISNLFSSARKLKSVADYHQGSGVLDLKNFLEVCAHDKSLSNKS
ncbi:S8 family peptidase [Paenisporosarcina sp. NPDC076907]